MPIQTPLLAVLPAAAVALILLAIAWRPWKPTGRGWWGSALTLGLAYPLADYLIFRNIPGFPPAEEHRWLPYIALAGAAFGLAEPLWRGRDWRGYAFAGLAAACIAPLLWVDLSRRGTLPFALLWLAVWTAVCSMLWTELLIESRRPAAARLPLILTLAATGAAAVTLQSYSASLGFAAGSIAAVAAVFFLLSLIRPAIPALPAATPAFALLLVGVLVAHASTPVEAKVLTAFSGATAGLASRGPFRRLPGWLGTLLAVAITVALIAAALYFTPGRYQFGLGSGY